MDQRIVKYLRCEIKAKKWIEAVLEEEIEADLSSALKSGVILCHLLLKLDENLIPVVYYGEDNTAYKLRENVEFFIQGMEEYGVKQSFHSVDLLTKRNMFRVVSSLLELANLAHEKGFPIGLIDDKDIKEPDFLSLSEAHRKTALLLNSKKVLRKFVKQDTKLRIQTLLAQSVEKPENSNIQETIEKEPKLPVEALTKFQAIVRGFLVRKHLLVIKRHNAYRSKVANEILETERHYVESLGQCINEYLNPLQTASSNASKPKKNKVFAPSLQTSTIRIIFSDIRMIHTFHLHSVLNVICPRVEAWNIYQCVGDVFLKITSMMKIYSQYIMNYSNSTQVYIDLQEDHEFLRWKNAIELRLEGKSLGSFLIMPVQRIPRYYLLLKDLFKHTWEDHPDYANLKQAAEEMEKVTKFLDEKKKESENLNRLASLASLWKGKIDINLIEPHRRLVREDIFEKQANIFLFNDLIVIERIDRKSHRRSLRFGSSSELSLNPLQKSSKQKSFQSYYLTKVEVIENARGFEVRQAGVHNILITCKASPEMAMIWTETFNKYKGECGESQKESIQSASRVLERVNSLTKLHNSYSVLQNHINSLDEQMKGLKHKKDKKELELLKNTFGARLHELDVKLTEKMANSKMKQTHLVRTRSTSLERPKSPTKTAVAKSKIKKCATPRRSSQEI